MLFLAVVVAAAAAHAAEGGVRGAKKEHAVVHSKKKDPAPVVYDAEGQRVLSELELVPPSEAAVLKERELAAAAAAAKEAEAEAAAAQTASAKPRVAAPGPLPPKRQPELEFLPGLPLNDENHMEPDYDGTSTLFPYGPPGDAAEPAPAEVSRVGADGIRRLYGVSVPTLTLHWPRGRRSDVAGAQPCVIVAPGGGYDALVIDREGHDVAEAFAARGFVAFVLKYRVPMEIPKPGKKESNDALADLQRAVSYVRAHADQFGVDADAVGVAGFDTGAHLAARAVGAKRAYGPIDWVDEAPATPSFLILNALLPPGDDVAPSSHATPKDRAPPAFVAHAVDDAAASYTASMDYFESRAGPRSQLAIYDRGGHDYGACADESPFEAADVHAARDIILARLDKAPICDWVDRAEAWLYDLYG